MMMINIIIDRKMDMMGGCHDVGGRKIINTV